jgi:hypothetical protein
MNHFFELLSDFSVTALLPWAGCVIALVGEEDNCLDSSDGFVTIGVAFFTFSRAFVFTRGGGAILAGFFVVSGAFAEGFGTAGFFSIFLPVSSFFGYSVLLVSPAFLPPLTLIGSLPFLPFSGLLPLSPFSGFLLHMSLPQ